MSSYEYKVVTAPSKGRRGRGVKGPDGRFAFSLELLMNEMAAEGWEYQRAETLPSEERSGLSSTQTVYRNVLIFRRKRAGDMSAYDPRLIEGPEAGTILLPPAAAPDEDGHGESDESLAGMLRRRASRLMTGSARDDAHAYEDEDGLAARDSDAAASLADRFARIDEEETVAAEADVRADTVDAGPESAADAAETTSAAAPDGVDADDAQDDAPDDRPGRGPLAGNGPPSHRAAAE
ncbi:MAG: hypothetical protein ACPH5G_16920 [Pseudooceanicola atlanticus]